jgi:hypothetical protein
MDALADNSALKAAFPAFELTGLREALTTYLAKPQDGAPAAG